MKLGNSMIVINDKTPDNSQVAMQSSVRSEMCWSSLLLGFHPPVCYFFFYGVLHLPMSVVFLLNLLTPTILSVVLLPVPYLALAWTFAWCNSNWIYKIKPRMHKLTSNLAHKAWNSCTGVRGHYFSHGLDSFALSDFSVHSTCGHIINMLLWGRKRKKFFPPIMSKTHKHGESASLFALWLASQ